MLKQFGGGYGADGAFADEADAQQHSKLEKLYISTRAAKVKKMVDRSFPSSRSLLGFVALSHLGSAYIMRCVFVSSQHFQRDIVRGVEGYIVTGSKQVEIGRQLS